MKSKNKKVSKSRSVENLSTLLHFALRSLHACIISNLAPSQLHPSIDGGVFVVVAVAGRQALYCGARERRRRRRAEGVATEIGMETSARCSVSSASITCEGSNDDADGVMSSGDCATASSVAVSTLALTSGESDLRLRERQLDVAVQKDGARSMLQSTKVTTTK